MSSSAKAPSQIGLLPLLWPLRLGAIVDILLRTPSFSFFTNDNDKPSSVLDLSWITRKDFSRTFDRETMQEKKNNDNNNNPRD